MTIHLGIEAPAFALALALLIAHLVILGRTKDGTALYKVLIYPDSGIPS
jgi:hypothetical protein